jgi:hypothetical protein
MPHLVLLRPTPGLRHPDLRVGKVNDDLFLMEWSLSFTFEGMRLLPLGRHLAHGLERDPVVAL